MNKLFNQPKVDIEPNALSPDGHVGRILPIPAGSPTAVIVKTISQDV